MTTLTLRGQVGREIAALFVEQLAGLGKDDVPVTLDMQEADIDDQRVTTVLVDYIRQAAARAGTIQILSAPQVLTQCLFRSGIVSGSGPIELIEPRGEP